MTLSEPAITMQHQKLVTARSGEARDGDDAFFIDVNSELSDQMIPGGHSRQSDCLGAHGLAHVDAVSSHRHD